MESNFLSITDSINGFSDNFYKTLDHNIQENVIYSPISIHIILSLLLNAAVGETKSQIQMVLNLFGSDQLNNEFKNFLDNLKKKTTENIDLEFTNIMYFHSDFEVKQNFLDQSSHVFETFIKTVNFSNNIDSATEINSWVKEKTKGKLNNVIKADDIDENTKMVLTNVLYLKCNWLHPFESKMTKKQIFYNYNNEEVFVPMMHKLENILFSRSEKLDASLIKLQYLNENFEMIIILPNKKDGLFELEKKFTWDSIKNEEFNTREVDVYLPKFKIESALNLKNNLNQLGVDLIFKDSADFNLITNNPLSVSKFIQKAFIEVDELGSESAAATVAQIRSRRMIVDTEDFVADHPFMFIIHYKPINIPLFTGRMKKMIGLMKKDEL